MHKLKLLVVGIDGASHSVLRDLSSKGDLPNLTAWSNEGIGGVLQSTFPPHTAPGWSSMFSGVNPGEHGIFQFWSTQGADYRALPVHAGQAKRQPIWKALERQGLTSGVYNVPMTHPPKAPEGGYMISWPLSPTLRYADPPTLISELATARLHYHSDLVTMYSGQSDYCSQAKKFIDGRTDTCLYLQKERPVDAMFVVYTELDRISHHYWGEYEKPSETVLDFYRQVDESIGRLLTLADQDTLVVVASDHGFGLCQNDLNIHKLLEEEGLFAADNAEASEDAAPWFRGDEVGRKSVDWSQTSVFMPTPGCFGLNLNLMGREPQGIVEPQKAREFETRLKKLFHGFCDETGSPYFELVARDQVYSGRAVTQAPDFLLIPKGWELMPTPTLSSRLWLPPIQGAVHQPDGIFFAKGPRVPHNQEVLARIEDITPFILAQLGLPIPENLDGHWLVELTERPTRETALLQEASRAMNVDEKTYMNKRLAEIGYF